MKSKKSALLLSFTSLLICFAMLVGSTFAWFTDTATTGVNQIQTGNLDVELEYSTNFVDWAKVDNTTKVFDENALWEPGRTEVVYLRVKNAGNLALKYTLGLGNVNGKAGKNVAGKTYFLRDYVKMGAVEATGAYADREEAIKAVSAVADTIGAIGEKGVVGETLKTGEEKIYAMVVYMPTTVGNEANPKYDKDNYWASRVTFGVAVNATQATVESDSFNNTYDAGAEYLDAVTITPANAPDYLDGKYGSIDGKTLILAAGDYGTLELGRATKYEGSNTEYRIGGFTGDAMTFDDFYARKNDGKFSEPPYYTRTISNLTLKAAGEGVNVNGIKMTSGHRYGSAAASITDYVLDRTISDNGGYYLAHHVNNLKFNGLNFTGVAFIYSACADTTFDGVTFVNCEFNGGGTDSNAAKGVDFRSEEGVAAMRNLTVTNCKFNNCYQGVYTQFINGITVADNEFDTTGHNAIAVQTGSNPFNHGAVIITNNTFTNIRDRIIRFGYVGADTQITIKNNTATSSGDSAGEVIKATSLADGITYDISGNDWGTGKTVVNEQLKDK